MSPGPRSLVLLALGALGAGCYSPSIESCRVACAAGETCPSGLTCVNGRCAAEAGETCLADDGGLPGRCGDGIWMPGEICFGSAITTTATLPDTIHQLQIANIDDDPELEIVVTAGTSLHAYEVQGEALVPRGHVTMESIGVVRALQLDGTQADELVVVAQTELRVLTRPGGGPYTTVQDATLDGDSETPVVVRAGRFGDPSGTFVVGSTAKVAVVSVGDELAISVLQSTPFMKVADVAVGQLDHDPEDELAIVTSKSIELWDADLENPVGGPLAIAGASRAVIGDFFGDAAPELVYVKQAGDVVPGELGVVQVRPEITMFVEDDTVEDLVGALETADLDRDGRSDLISLQAGRTNAVLVWRAGEMLGTPHVIEIPIAAFELAPPADLTGDGEPDLVITDGATLVLLPSSP